MKTLFVLKWKFSLLGHREALASELWRQMYNRFCLNVTTNLSLRQMHLHEVEAVWQKQHSALHRPKILPRNYVSPPSKTGPMLSSCAMQLDGFKY